MRRARVAALAALALTATALAPATASAHLGRAGYVARVEALRPAVPGLRVAVLGGDDQLSVTNHTTKTVTVLGADAEPYVRFAPSGAVAVNVNAPSLYRDGGPTAAAALPATASATAAPRWETVARDGTYAWHDRRIRGAAGAWRVPLRVGATAATVAGELRRAPAGGGGVGPGLLLAFFGPALLVLAAVVFLNRREPRPTAAAEAW